MIADKVNQAQNVIIAEIKKRAQGRDEKVVRIENRARVITNYAHFIKQIKRFNDVCAYERVHCHFSLTLDVLVNNQN